MKRRIFFVLSLFLIVCMTVPVYAEEATQTTVGKNEIDAGLVSILNNQLSEADKEILYNKELHGDSLKHIDMENEVIIKEYMFGSWLFWELAQDSLEELIAYGETKRAPRYLMLTEEKNVRLVINELFPLSINNDHVDQNYIADLRNMEATMNIMDTQCTIQNIYCFPYPELDEVKKTAVYVRTDQGIFVKYYEDESDEGSWYTEEAFKELAKEYYEEIMEEARSNYNEEGKIIVGGSGNLNPTTTQPDTENAQPFDLRHLFWILPTGAIVLTVAIGFPIWRVKKRKMIKE